MTAWTKAIIRLAGSGTTRRGEDRNLQEPHKMGGPKSRSVFGIQMSDAGATDGSQNRGNNGVQPST